MRRSRDVDAAAGVVVASCSLLLPSRNRRELLRETMASITAGDTLPAEFVIVDQSDAPDDDLAGLVLTDCAARGVTAEERPPAIDGGAHRSRTAEEADRAPRVIVRYVHSRTVGLSRALNLAIAWASHPLLVCTHDDVRVQPDWLSTLVAAAERWGADEVLTGRVLPEPGEPGTFVPTTIERTEAAVYDRPLKTWDPLLPLNMAMHRCVPERVGRFDERLGPGTRFPGAEDNEFAYRVLRAGLRVRYVPEATLYHRAWRRMDEFTALRWAYGRGQGAFLAKHATTREWYAWGRLGGLTFRRLTRFPYNVLRIGPRAFADLAYLAGVLTAFAEWKWSYRGSADSTT